MDHKNFSYDFNLEDGNERPALTGDFASALVQFFAGGHTPQIRSALLELERAAKDADTIDK